MAMSELDNDLLIGVQRSWVLERLNAIKRYGKSIGIDYDYVAQFSVRVYRDYVRGTPRA